MRYGCTCGMRNAEAEGDGVSASSVAKPSVGVWVKLTKARFGTRWLRGPPPTGRSASTTHAHGNAECASMIPSRPRLPVFDFGVAVCRRIHNFLTRIATKSNPSMNKVYYASYASAALSRCAWRTVRRRDPEVVTQANNASVPVTFNCSLLFHRLQCRCRRTWTGASGTHW